MEGLIWRIRGFCERFQNYKKYTFSSEFYGYGTYKGGETLETLGKGSAHKGKNYAGIPLDKLKPGDFQPLTRDQAKEKALSSLYDKGAALEPLYKKLPNGETALGYRRAGLFTSRAENPIAACVRQLLEAGGQQQIAATSVGEGGVSLSTVWSCSSCGSHSRD